MIENVADQRQISESRAAHACLLLLIEHHEQLFMAPADMLARCKFNYFDESVPVRISLIVFERGVSQISYLLNPYAELYPYLMHAKFELRFCETFF